VIGDRVSSTSPNGAEELPLQKAGTATIAIVAVRHNWDAHDGWLSVPDHPAGPRLLRSERPSPDQKIWLKKSMIWWKRSFNRPPLPQSQSRLDSSTLETL
jgi:hypothetical protein